MTLHTSEQPSTQDTQEIRPVTQNLVAQKLPFRQPQVGPLCHVLQKTGEGGTSNEFDSYRDNRK